MRNVNDLQVGVETDKLVAEGMGTAVVFEQGGLPTVWCRGVPVAYSKDRYVLKYDETVYLHATDGYTGMLPAYSQSLNSAWDIVHWLLKHSSYDKFCLQSVHIDADRWRFYIGKDNLSGSPDVPFNVLNTNWVFADASTEALAVCRAFIKLVDRDKATDQTSTTIGE